MRCADGKRIILVDTLSGAVSEPLPAEPRNVGLGFLRDRDEFAALDRASGGTFPFTHEQIQAAHARWTTEWLAWERSHDAEYKLKAALAEQELGDRLNSPSGRARIDVIERDKLDRYQQRYEEYTRIARGLQALASKS